MSQSFNRKNYSVTKQSEKKQNDSKLIHRRYSPNPTFNNNIKLIQNNESSFSGITNFSMFKEKDKQGDNYPYFSFPVKSLDEINIEDYFLQKNKKTFQSHKVINNKTISFQRQKDKKILEFVLFDDKIIFKDINRAYLQDENSDDGDDSSDEKINLGKNLLIQELEESSKVIKEKLKYTQERDLFSRPIRFKK